jgi:hypothetical protein
MLTKTLLSNLVCFIVLVLLSCSLAYSQNCFYDKSVINKEYFLSNTKFKDGQWNNELKEATINVKKSETVKIKYYACEHIGMSAKYIIENSTNDASECIWKHRVIWLAEHVLKDSDINLLLTTIESDEFRAKINEIKSGEELFVLVEGSDYIEFIISFNSSSTQNIVQISWYY